MIKMLNADQWKIMKEISIVSKNRHDIEIVVGTIYYQRDITKNYKLGNDHEPDKIIRLINYPKQDLFPQDNLDNLILSAITNKFPNSFVKSYEIFFNADSAKFEHFRKRPSEKAIIEVRPDFSQVNYQSLVENSFSLYRKEINIYQEFLKDSIQFQFFSSICDFATHGETIKKLNEIIEFL